MLRQSFFFISCLLLSVSCSQQESKKWKTLQNVSDSVVGKHELIDVRIENDHYNLKIDQDSPFNGSYPSFRITLMKSTNIILSKRVSPSLFADSLRKQDYGNPALKGIEFTFVRSNRLYFLARFQSAHSSSMDTINFAIFYRTNKIGRLDYW